MTLRRAILITTLVSITLLSYSMYRESRRTVRNAVSSSPPHHHERSSRQNSMLVRRKHTLSHSAPAAAASADHRAKRFSMAAGKGKRFGRREHGADGVGGAAAVPEFLGGDDCPYVNLFDSESAHSHCIVAHCPEEGSYIRRWLEKLRAKRLLLRDDDDDDHGDDDKTTRRLRQRFQIVNVGSNKGFVVASALNALGVSGFSPRELGTAVLARAKELFSFDDEAQLQLLAAGHCCDAFAEPQQESMSSARPFFKDFRSIHVTAFDPVAANVKFLRDFVASRELHKKVIEIDVVHAAAADENKTVLVPFPDVAFGEERGSLFLQAESGGRRRRDGAAANSVVMVPQVSLDAFFARSALSGGGEAKRKKRWPFIDCLFIDAEGSDDNVLRGAWEKLIRRGKVGLIVFEVGHSAAGSALAASIKFRKMIENLDVAGYSSFFPLQQKSAAGASDCRRVLPISGKCWREEFGRALQWGNVVGVNRREPELVAVFDELREEAREFWPLKCDTLALKEMKWKL